MLLWSFFAFIQSTTVQVNTQFWAKKQPKFQDDQGFYGQVEDSVHNTEAW